MILCQGLHAECELLRIGDIRYFFLNSVRPGVMVSVRPPLTVTLDHIDRLNAAIAAQLPPRRPTVSDRKFLNEFITLTFAPNLFGTASIIVVCYIKRMTE